MDEDREQVCSDIKDGEENHGIDEIQIDNADVETVMQRNDNAYVRREQHHPGGMLHQNNEKIERRIECKGAARKHDGEVGDARGLRNDEKIYVKPLGWCSLKERWKHKVIS